MKVLYIGQYRDCSSASKSSASLIQSLISSGVDLSIRPLKLDNYRPKVSGVINSLEEKKQLNYDCCIQHVPANMLVYNKRFSKNICYINHHTDNFYYNGWTDRINMMDEVWVPSEFVKTICQNSKVKIPIKVVPFGCNSEVFLKKYQTYPQIKQEKNGDFLFYTISSSFSRRKNFNALIKAFHLEFNKNEPVNLVIKFNKDKTQDDMSPKEFINQMKLGLNLGDTKEEIILPCHYLDDNDILSIHNSCDTFVSSSYGEGWCTSAFEALAFGKTPIVNDWSGCEYINESTGWRVKSNLEPVFGMNRNSSYTGRENWGAISIAELRKCMREAYEGRNSKAEAGLEKMFEYTHDVVGSIIKKVLYEKASESK
jgi:glycosyltransferase involved in cell wall biosynthesis